MFHARTHFAADPLKVVSLHLTLGYCCSVELEIAEDPRKSPGGEIRQFCVLQFPLWRRNGLRGTPSAPGEPELVRNPASSWSLCPAFSRVKRKQLVWGGARKQREK